VLEHVGRTQLRAAAPHAAVIRRDRQGGRHSEGGASRCRLPWKSGVLRSLGKQETASLTGVCAAQSREVLTPRIRARGRRASLRWPPVPPCSTREPTTAAVGQVAAAHRRHHMTDRTDTGYERHQQLLPVTIGVSGTRVRWCAPGHGHRSAGARPPTPHHHNPSPSSIARSRAARCLRRQHTRRPP
jgi:hypothetical protein